MPKPSVSIRLCRASDKARAQGWIAWADLMIEASDELIALRRKPNKQDEKFKRAALKFLKTAAARRKS